MEKIEYNQDKIDKLYNKLKAEGYKLQRDRRRDSSMFYSEVYGRWIPLSSVKGQCPVCNTPQVALDISSGYCGYCGAAYGNNYKEVI